VDALHPYLHQVAGLVPPGREKDSHRPPTKTVAARAVSPKKTVKLAHDPDGDGVYNPAGISVKSTPYPPWKMAPGKSRSGLVSCHLVGERLRVPMKNANDWQGREAQEDPPTEYRQP
jgi:hypothetical protein